MAQGYWYADVSWEQERKYNHLAELHDVVFSNLSHEEKLDALRDMETLRSQGSLLSALYLATYYEMIANRDNYEKAIDCMKIAAKMGSRHAQCRAAVLQLFSRRDVEEAETTLKTLAEQNHLSAQFRLAMHLYKKDKIGNRAAALDYLKTAARGGHLLAKQKLAVIMMSSGHNLLERIRGAFLLIGASAYVFYLLAMLKKKSALMDEMMYS